MKFQFCLAVFCLLSASALLNAQQIAPNGNPSGKHVYVETPSITNDIEFINNGDIEVTKSGTLTNNNSLYNAASGYVGNNGHLNNKSVSWVRSKDNHILTVDRETFISGKFFP